MEFTDEEKEMILNSLGAYLNYLEEDFSEIEGWNNPVLEKELRGKIDMARNIANKINPDMRYY